MPKITNLNELRRDLIEAYETLKADPKRVVQVSELANTAGKVVAATKLEVEYQMLRRKVTGFPKIDFLE